MPYYITATNDICNAEAVNLAYQQELQKCGNWFETREYAERVAKMFSKIAKDPEFLEKVEGL